MAEVSVCFREQFPLHADLNKPRRGEVLTNPASFCSALLIFLHRRDCGLGSGSQNLRID